MDMRGLTSHPDGFNPWKETLNPLYRKLGGPQNWPGCFNQVKNPFSLTGFESLTIQRVE
jgi:hypothetical protein